MNVLVKRGAFACFFATGVLLISSFIQAAHAQDINTSELNALTRNYVPEDSQKNRYTQNAIDTFMKNVEKSTNCNAILTLFHDTFGEKPPAAGVALYASCKSFASIRILSLSIVEYANDFFKDFTKIQQNLTQESILKEIVQTFAKNMKTSASDDALSVHFTVTISPLAKKLCNEITDIFFKIYTLLSPFASSKDGISKELVLKTPLYGTTTRVSDLMQTIVNKIVTENDTNIKNVKAIIEGVYIALNNEIKTIKSMSTTLYPAPMAAPHTKRSSDSSKDSKGDFPPPMPSTHTKRSPDSSKNIYPPPYKLKMD